MDPRLCELLRNEQTNVVELYLCPQGRDKYDSGHAVVGWTRDRCFDIQTMGPGHVTKIQDYYRFDMCYSYDLDSDTQRITRRSVQLEVSDGGSPWYGIAWKEEVLPSHRFPCTRSNISRVVTVRKSYRISNRMHLVHDLEDDINYYYIRYQHAPNLDMTKMQSDFQRAIRVLHRSSRPTQR